MLALEGYINNLNSEEMHLADFRSELLCNKYTTEWYHNLRPDERALFHIKLTYAQYIYGIDIDSILTKLNRPMVKVVYRLYDKINKSYSKDYYRLIDLRNGCNVKKLKIDLGWKYNQRYIIHKDTYIISGDEYIKIK